MVKIKSRWDKLDEKAQKWAKRLTAIATIVGVLAAAGGWLITQLDNAVAVRLESQTASLQQEVEALSKEMEERDKQTELQLTRLELMMLMSNDPENIVEIEKVAYRYFHDLNGDTWMDSEYSKYCRTYSADCNIMLK